MQTNSDLIEFAALVPGERFLQIGSPHVVCRKTSHTWATIIWKDHVSDFPLHWTTLVRRAPVGQRNPGELFA